MKTKKKNGFSPPKGFNTRKKLKEANQVYVRLLCEELRKKIQSEWAEKFEPRKCGSSLEECRKLRRYSSFIRHLNQDILHTYYVKDYENEKGISPSALGRFLNSEKPCNFFQKYIGNILSVYLGYQSWEHFKQENSRNVNSALNDKLIASPAELPKKTIKKEPVIATTYINSFWRVHHTAS